MTPTLVVVRPFAGHAKGDAISDAATVAQILGTEHAVNVVRVATASPSSASPAAASPPAAPATAEVQQGG